MSTSPSEIFDQLALDVANRKLTLAGAFNVAYLKGYDKGVSTDDDSLGRLFDFIHELESAGTTSVYESAEELGQIIRETVMGTR